MYEIARLDWMRKSMRTLAIPIFPTRPGTLLSLFDLAYWESLWIAPKTCVAQSLWLLHGTTKFEYEAMVFVAAVLNHLEASIAEKKIEKPNFLTRTSGLSRISIPASHAGWDEQKRMTADSTGNLKLSRETSFGKVSEVPMKLRVTMTILPHGRYFPYIKKSFTFCHCWD